MSWTVLGTAFMIFCLRIVDVSMGTFRTIMVTRGRSRQAALIGFIEITIWLVAVSQVIRNVNNVLNVICYSGGFAMGTFLGIWIEEKLALGYVNIRIISMNKGEEIASILRREGYGITRFKGEGQNGPVHLLYIIALRRKIRDITRIADKIDNTSFITIDEARHVMRGYQGIGKLV